MRAVQAANHGWARFLGDLRQRQRLAGAGIFLRDADVLIDDSGKATAEALLLLQALPALSTPVKLELHLASRWHDLLRGRRVLAVSLVEPEPALRLELWSSTLAAHGFEWDDPLVTDLADRFTLAPGQIGDVVQRAADRRLVQGEGAAEPSRQLLFAAAREQSDRQLARLAAKVATHFRWDDSRRRRHPQRRTRRRLCRRPERQPDRYAAADPSGRPQQLKQGKVPSAMDCGRYHPLLADREG